jgi:hypothetical protein
MWRKFVEGLWGDIARKLLRQKRARLKMSNLSHPTPARLLTSLYAQCESNEPRDLLQAATAYGIKSQCLVCAQEVQADEISFPAKFASSFGDTHSLISPSLPGRICADCYCALRLRAASVQFSYCALGTDPRNQKHLVAYKTLSTIDFVAAIYHPPKVPFLLVRKDRKRQHNIWKAQVNTVEPQETDLVLFTSGESQYYCRPQQTLKLFAKQQELMNQAHAIRLNSQSKSKGKGSAVAEKKPSHRIFQSLSMDKSEARDFAPINFRVGRNAIEDESLLNRIEKLQTVISSLSTGDRMLYVFLNIVSNKHDRAPIEDVVQGLTPTEIDLPALMSGN